MQVNFYQQAAMRTCRHTPGSQQALVEAALGLAGETGEAVDIVKKTMFGGHPLDKEKLLLEMGDIAWYLAEMCLALGVTFQEVLEMNIKKLEKRYPQGCFTTQDSIARRDTNGSNSSI